MYPKGSRAVLYANEGHGEVPPVLIMNIQSYDSTRGSNTRVCNDYKIL